MPAKEFYKLKKGDKVHLKWCKNDDSREALNYRIDDTTEVTGYDEYDNLNVDLSLCFNKSNLERLDPDDNIIEIYDGTTRAYYPDDSREQVTLLMKRLADAENTIKRLRNEIESLQVKNESDLIKLLLPAFRDFDTAIEYAVSVQNDKVVSGFIIAYSNLIKILYNKGLKKIECVGEPFDYNLHNAIKVVQNHSISDDIITDEVSPGYIYNDIVLKHSDVIVNSNK